jgi:resuscitation-promoting factor RpfA
MSVVGMGVGTLAAAAVIAPTAAHAATDVQWDRVAHCESGDNWHTNTGNGYYGGLQFSSSTWSSFDVDKFASRADLASRHEQMTVADRVLRRQGWGAWPVCSRYAGDPGPADADVSTAHHHKNHNHHKARHHHRVADSAAAIGAHPGKVIRYRVKSGDTLSSIARHENVKGGWLALYRSNRQVIGSNPGLIHVGDELRLRLRRI